MIDSFGGGPTSAQRTELLHIVDKLQHVPRTIMVTASAMVRGIISALTWFIAPPKRAKVFAEHADKVERRSVPIPPRAERGPRPQSTAPRT